jgi:hypothetical protein
MAGCNGCVLASFSPRVEPRIDSTACYTGLSDSEIQALVEGHLSAFMAETFDQPRADEHVQKLKGIPPWIHTMVAKPAWRQLVYSLCAKHPDSKCLELFIQVVSVSARRNACTHLGFFSQVISNGNHDMELLSVRSYNVNRMAVFVKALAHAIDKALHETNADSLRSTMDSLSVRLRDGWHL